ncbi:peptide-methionine (R)-S-oxide reductase MsrB [Nitrosomonas sp.]|uniref:peptide-methionine (R)-S-oxide reductase MsrB n=1 Tax=Nitrosomonas sp. TaxID=42353 RepID=UPI001DCB5C8F|nr:peptide-methionine (R)-S-oxide reductase MsrB [Nitrosomonas sp.]MBX3616646.1 peptide-methionine (R)-S-oxide reductase MsrB [Nitrosomonas sp.]
MKRRTFLQQIAVLPILSTWLPIRVFASDIAQGTVQPLKKPHHAWREILSPEAFQVLFEEHTEEPGSSVLNGEYREGTYICAACYLPLFESAHKYESGTGWPSFTQPIAGHIGTKRDYSLIFLRTEYHCARCGGHQGHVFKDGPSPRGERWCNNGVALQFVLQSEPLPGLRS